MKIDAITLPLISRLQLIKYAGASGDFNPIHTIDEEANKTGLPGVIAHGMLTMGMMARLFSPYMDRGMIQDYSTRFLNKVFVDDQITARAEWERSEEGDKGTVHYYTVLAENGLGQMVAKGKLSFLMFS